RSGTKSGGSRLASGAPRRRLSVGAPLHVFGKKTLGKSKNSNTAQERQITRRRKPCKAKRRVRQEQTHRQDGQKDGQTQSPAVYPFHQKAYVFAIIIPPETEVCSLVSRFGAVDVSSKHSTHRPTDRDVKRNVRNHYDDRFRAKDTAYATEICQFHTQYAKAVTTSSRSIC
ncbi:unnamed protein product, partial [Ectocarpus sp. 12 AP-2014]